MGNPEELALVVKALQSGLGGCVEWHHKEVDRIRQELIPYGLTPESVRQEVIAFVRRKGAVRQVQEKRDERKDQRVYYYKVVLPLENLKKGLFVEIVLWKADEDYPEVLLVSAHE
jgi:hypothetical protein